MLHRSNALVPNLWPCIHPVTPILQKLLLPDRNVFLQFIDHLLAGGEGGLAVVAAYGDDDGDVANGQFAYAVVNGHGVEVMLGYGLFSDAGHFFGCHRNVALKIEVGYGFAFVVVADGAYEEADTSAFGGMYEGVGGVDA